MNCKAYSKIILYRVTFTSEKIQKEIGDNSKLLDRKGGKQERFLISQGNLQ